jgi:hypothetical protein
MCASMLSLLPSRLLKEKAELSPNPVRHMHRHVVFCMMHISVNE